MGIRFFLSLLVAATSLSLTARGAVVVYDVIPAMELSSSFTLEVRNPVGGGNWHSVPVYSIAVDKVTDGHHRTEWASFAYFDFSGRVELRVRTPEAPSQVRVRPLSKNITPHRRGRCSTFFLDAPANLSFEADGDIFHNLHIFANPLPGSAADSLDGSLLGSAADSLGGSAAGSFAGQGKADIVFGPGYHKLEGSIMDIPSGSTVYVDGAAWVDGTLRVKDAENVRIFGSGIVRPKGRGYGVEIKNSRNVTVEGLILTQCPIGGSRDVTIRNVKSITHYGWGDGLNVFASSNVLFDGVFCRNSDDCTTVYATRMGYVGGCSNIRMQNSVLWADVAHPIFIGLHGAASYKEDVQSRNLPFTEDPDEVTRRNDVIENLTYYNIDILDHAEKQIDYQGCMAIVCGDNNIVRNVLFDNVRVEDFRQGQLLCVRIIHNRKYCQAPGLSISGVTFRDVVYNGKNASLSLIGGYDSERSIEGIVFENLSLNGRLISDDMSGKPKWYKTSDFAGIAVGNHVGDIIFK